MLPISLIDTLDPEERALIVGGKVEAYWSDLTIRLKSALRARFPSSSWSTIHHPLFIIHHPASISRDLGPDFLAIARILPSICITASLLRSPVFCNLSFSWPPLTSHCIVLMGYAVRGSSERSTTRCTR